MIINSTRGPAAVLMSACLVLLALLGCEKPKTAESQPRPRPVVTQPLSKTLPPHSALVSASVASWKTEQIGFEISGRVEWVLEPNEEIIGRVFDDDGNKISEGTPIGQIESERYRLQVSKSEAEVKRAEQNLIAANTELNESIPAQIEAAQASEDLAEIEFRRSERLFEQKAAPKSDLDRDRANYQNAISQVKQLRASQTAKKAEIERLENEVLQAKENLRDAQRNVEDCTLYSSFNGQIASVSVVPGSVVNAGSPVATIQMMNPIKIELEVSAQDSRRLQRTERLPVSITMPDGSESTKQAYLYLIDPVADTLTRTFTVTLLMMNEKLNTEMATNVTATTQDVWRLDFKFLPGAEPGMLFVDENAILEDADGSYLWMVTNATSESRDTGERFFKVRKLRIDKLERKIPYLGNWVFQQIETRDAQFNPALNIVIGKLNVASGDPEKWDGDTVFMDKSSQWELRPGDLVKVDLSGPDAVPGFYVPMNAIIREDDSSSIFIIEDSGVSKTAKKLPVTLAEQQTSKQTTSSLLRIEPADGTSLDGLELIIEGAHYLIDGESVMPVAGGQTK